MHTKETIHAELDASAAAVVKAVLAIHARQTPDEQQAGYTRLTNGVGFSKFDAEPMTRFVQFVNNGRRISPKFLGFARKRMKHYWQQLIEVAEQGASNASIAPEHRIEPAVAARPAPAMTLTTDLNGATQVGGRRLCDCEWGDGEPDVTCPAKRIRCCTGGKVIHEDIEEGNAFGAEERKREEEAFMHDPDMVRSSW